VSLPFRILQYLDPNRDYLCQKLVTEERADAVWQQDKDWLNGVDRRKVRNPSTWILEMTKAIQAANGHWYRRIIVESAKDRREDYEMSPLEVRLIKTVYVGLSPKFPEGIFDPDELPGQ
jgi:hypothetical protein